MTTETRHPSFDRAIEAQRVAATLAAFARLCHDAGNAALAVQYQRDAANEYEWARAVAGTILAGEHLNY